jgi:hypothetical protein
LHVDLVVVVLIYQLEVLDRGLVDSAIKVEHEGLDSYEKRIRIFKTLTFVPLGRLVEEKHYVLGVVLFKLLLDCVVAIRGFPHKLTLVSVYIRQ